MSTIGVQNSRMKGIGINRGRVWLHSFRFDTIWFWLWLNCVMFECKQLIYFADWLLLHQSLSHSQISSNIKFGDYWGQIVPASNQLNDWAGITVNNIRSIMLIENPQQLQHVPGNRELRYGCHLGTSCSAEKATATAFLLDEQWRLM